MEIFRWNDWNLEHATRHGCSVEEIQLVIYNEGRRGFRRMGDGKWGIEGRGIGDRIIKVVFIRDPHPFIYVIHAIPLTTRRRRR